MFVVQFSWLPLLWLNAYFLLPFSQTYPLKYASGYNYDFHHSQSAQSTQSAQSEQNVSQSEPYLSYFKLSSLSFADNFNFSLTLQLLSILFVIATYIRYRKIHDVYLENTNE